MIDVFDRLPAAVRAIAPRLSDDDLDAWVAAMTGPMRADGLTTPRRVACWLGHVAVETGSFTELEEDLNYSSAGMRRVWPSRFPDVGSTLPFVMNGPALANHVYCDRMGNGPESSGDGWTFRGRGLLQTTGRAAYAEAAAALGRAPAEAFAEWMATKEGAAAAGVWDFSVNLRCLPLADDWEITASTLRINGGYTGLDARETACATALRALTS